MVEMMQVLASSKSFRLWYEDTRGGMIPGDDKVQV